MNYIEYKKMNDGIAPACISCKFFRHFSLIQDQCIINIRKNTKEHFDACTKFNSTYEG